jgi:hypothetical protein
MAEPTQYTFDLKEVTVALLKEQGIHEGLWTLSFEIVLGAGQFGPTQAEAKPGAIMQINKLQLLRQAGGTPEIANVVDAAIVNPPRTKGRSSEPMRRRAATATD